MVGEDPLLDEAGALDIFPEFEWAQTEGLCNWLDTGTDNIFDFFGSWDLHRGGEKVQVSGQSRALVEKHERGSSK